MNINSVVYENLTPRQRIIATIEAEARGDEDETRRLVKSCPKKTYMQTASEYSDMMDALISMAMAFECDLRGEIISFLIANRAGNESMGIHLQNIADLQAAWDEVLKARGINPESMKKIACPPHYALEGIMNSKLIPDSNPSGVKDYREAVESYLEKIK